MYKEREDAIPNEKECLFFFDENGIILLQFRNVLCTFSKNSPQNFKGSKKNKDTIPTSEKNDNEFESFIRCLIFLLSFCFLFILFAFFSFFLIVKNFLMNKKINIMKRIHNESKTKVKTIVKPYQIFLSAKFKFSNQKVRHHEWKRYKKNT